MEPAMTAPFWTADSALPVSMFPGRAQHLANLATEAVAVQFAIDDNIADLTKSPTSSTETIKRTAKQSLVGTTATPPAEERLAALDELQRLMKERRINFDKWLRTIREGRR
jgi:hypothetical protein